MSCTAIARRGTKALLGPHRPYANYYYCYGLERAAAIMDVPAEQWYVDGARYLVKQQGSNGSWTDVYNTSLALLFLTRATRSILTPRRKRGPITAADSRFPEVVTTRTLKRAFEAYLLAGEARRKAWAPRFGAAGPSAIGLFVERLADPEESVRVVAYGLLLPPAILATPRLGCINVHASLLPRWRGAAPIERAIPIPTRSATKISAPNCSSWTAPTNARMRPTRKLMRVTMGRA